MTGRKKFFYNGILMSIVGLAMRSVGMLFGVLVSRAVGAEGVGIYTLVMTVYAFALTLATSGIGITVTKHVAEAVSADKKRVGGVMRGAFLYSLIFGVGAFLLLFFGADLIGNAILKDSRVISSLRVLSFSLIPSALSSVLSGYFLGIRRVGANAATQVLSNAFKIVLTLVFVIGIGAENTEKAIFLVCLGITLTEILSLILLFVQYLIIGAGISRGKSELMEISKTALPFGFSAYVRSSLLTVEHIMIPKKLVAYRQDTAAALSDYGTLHGMALPLVTYPMSPLSSFAGLLVPEFAGSYANNDKKRLSRICSESIGATLTYAIIVCCMLSLFAEELGYVIYSSYEAGRFISLLAPLVPIMYLDHVTDAVLKGIGEQVFSMWVNIADSLLSVILVCILIPRMGIVGYAVVIILMEVFNFSLSYMRLRSKISFSIPFIRSVLVPLISSVCAIELTKCGFVMCGKDGATPMWLALKLVFALCVFFAVKIPLGVLLKKMIKGRIRIIRGSKCKQK